MLRNLLRARSVGTTKPGLITHSHSKQGVHRLFSTGNVGIGVKNTSNGSITRKIGKWSFGVAATGVIGGCSYLYFTDEGFYRSVVFWKVVMPIYLEYKLTERRTKTKSSQERDEAFDELHRRHAPTVEAGTLQLRGYYLKAAQMLSTMDNFLPEPYLNWCQQLQNEVPTELSTNQAREIIESNLGIKISDTFEYFNENPIGCASIGQVYKATLKTPIKINNETIQEVAIKVQGPGIERRFRSDLSTIKMFCKIALPQFIVSLEEIEKQFKTEFDFLLEAENLQTVNKNIMPVFGDKVKVPLPVLDLCSKEVLVMEFIPGQALIKAVKANFKKMALKSGKSYEELEKQQTELIKSGKFNFKQIDEEIATTKRNQFYLDLSWRSSNAIIGFYNYTLGFLLGKVEYKPRDILINLAEIIRTVSLVHGHEILVDGAVNGDPHPGNILLMEDGRLGLIDYGQVKYFSKEFRQTYAKILLALCNDDVDLVHHLVTDVLGVKTKYNSKEHMFKLTKFWNDNNSKELMGGLNAHYFLEKMEAEDPSVELCEDLVIPGRVSFLLRAMGNAFGIDLRMAELWKPIAIKVLEQE